MPSYIIKSRKLNMLEENIDKISIGKFYSADRFYTILNEYIDINLSRRNVFMAWIIKILFKSSNFKHDSGIANGHPLSVRLFDWISIICLIFFICLSFGSIGTLIPLILGIIGGKWSNFEKMIDPLKTALLSVGIPAIITGIPAIFWLWVHFAIRKKNKPLTLQAFVEKKIWYCLKLRFLIRNIEIHYKKKHTTIILLENFEGQGVQAPRWLNIQLINLICSIFPNFNYIFKFDKLTDDEVEELKQIIAYDFKNVELIEADDFDYRKWEFREEKITFRIKNKSFSLDKI